MPRPRKISRQIVLDAASHMVALHGLSGLSMRGLGKELGVEAMSLYKYVGRREDLVSLLRIWLFSSVRLPEPAKTPRRDLEAVCSALFRGLVAAPGASYLVPPQPARDLDDAPESGVALMEPRAGLMHRAPWLPIVERILSSLRALIPEPLDRAYAAHALVSFVLGQAIFAGESGGFLGERLSPGAPLLNDFPEVAEALAAVQKRSPEVEFELGLRALLDAMEARRGF